MIYSPRRPYLSTFFPFCKHIFKKSKVVLGMEMQPLAECEWKPFWPGGAYSTFKGLNGCSFCSPSSALDSNESSGTKVASMKRKVSCGKHLLCLLTRAKTVNGVNRAKLSGHTAKSFWIFPLYLLNIHLYSGNNALVPGVWNYWVFKLFSEYKLSTPRSVLILSD